MAEFKTCHVSLGVIKICNPYGMQLASSRNLSQNSILDNILSASPPVIQSYLLHVSIHVLSCFWPTTPISQVFIMTLAENLCLKDPLVIFFSSRNTDTNEI